MQHGMAPSKDSQEPCWNEVFHKAWDVIDSDGVTAGMDFQNDLSGKTYYTYSNKG